MSDKHINISFTSGTVIKTIIILVVAALLYQLRSLALIVLTAIVIASAVEPGVRGLTRRGLPRILGVLCVYALLF